MLMSLGNIHSKIRNNPSKKAWRLIAYIPVVNWLDVDTIRTTLQNRLYHQCMEFILQSLIDPGLHGVDICDSKGDTRHSYLRIAAHLADLPEQSLIACATRLSSPVTTAGWEDLDNPQPSPPRTREWILSRIEAVSQEVPPGDVLRYQKAAKSRGLNGVHRPFWRDLPGYQPELCLAPDLLHGVIRFWRDHILKWALKLVGPAKFDQRLMALQPVVGFQQFKSGIQHLSQWTMGVDRELLRTFVVITAHCPSITPTLMQNFRAFSDFLMLVQYRSHSDQTLEYLDDALKVFHRTLPEYIRTGARSGKKGVINHFRIPKLSLFHTYKAHIIEMGTSPQFSTEIIESNHRSMAKDAYNATNHKDHMKQMCRVLDRGERIDYREEFLQWYAEQCEIEELEKQYEMYTPVYRKFVVERTLEERRNTKDEEKSIRFASKHARIWVTERPSHAHLQVIAIAEEYGLPDLPDRIGRHLRRTGHTLSFRDVDYLDVWTRLHIRAESAQGDGTDPPHTVEALPPSDDLPWGRCHCVLVHEGDEVYNVGLHGMSLV
jgi:Plavaka transposase